MRKKLTAVTIFTLGMILLIYTWRPILEWQFLIKPKVTNNSKSSTFLSPLSQYPNHQNFQGEIASQQVLGAQKQKNIVNGVKTFYLTIDKFKINKAKVVTGYDFLNQLAHYPGTAGPGEVGNVVISGHSILPQFFSPENYYSIFSKLYLLEKGDTIVLEGQNESYTYIVSDLLVVKPTDIWVLSPPEPYSSYLTLLTCGVGGWTQERIIVRAKLVNSQKII